MRWFVLFALLGLIVGGCNEYDLHPDDDTDGTGDDDDDDNDDDDNDDDSDDDDSEPDPDGFDPDGGVDDDDDSDDDDDDDGSPYGDTPVGRVLTILLTLNDMYMDQSISQQLLLNSVAWVTPDNITAPRVLIIRDDEHSGENEEDSDEILANLLAAGYIATLIEEPEDGIDTSYLAGYSVAILSNPGHSPDDEETLEALFTFSCAGYGIIFQGDDMAHFDDEDDFQMEDLTRLEYIDNGTEYYGYDVDNDDGDRYEVTVVNISHPVVAGIENAIFYYGDDIDTTEPSHTYETVLAWATVEGTGLPLKPAIAGYSQP